MALTSKQLEYSRNYYKDHKDKYKQWRQNWMGSNPNNKVKAANIKLAEFFYKVGSNKMTAAQSKLMDQLVVSLLEAHRDYASRKHNRERVAATVVHKDKQRRVGLTRRKV